MDNQEIETGDLRLTIRRDIDLLNPREGDQMSRMVCWHRRLSLGDETPKEDPSEYEIPEGSVVLPLYLHEHGAITLDCTAFSAPWDSGQVGWIYATPEKIRECMLVEEINDGVREHVKRCMQAEVSEYDSYLRGDVWGFELEKAEVCECCDHVKWEHVESCWGFYDLAPKGDFEGSSAKDAIAENLDEDALKLLDEAWEQRVYE